MSGLEIALLVVGILFFVGSFFFSEKLSSSDIETIEKMSEKEVNILVEKQLRNASEAIDANIQSRLNDSLNQFDKETNKKTTEEIYSISEHGDTVRASLDAAINTEQKTRDEVMFLYDRLSDKQDAVTELENEASKMESSLRAMKQSIEEAIERLEKDQKIAQIVPDKPAVSSSATDTTPDTAPETEEDPEVAELLKSMAEVVGSADKLIKEETVAVPEEDKKPAELSFEDEIARQLDEEIASTEEENGGGNINEKIIALHREGFEDVEIAKQLGKGLGEIKLVLGLFDEE